jgi:hypothetical protein
MQTINQKSYLSSRDTYQEINMNTFEEFQKLGERFSGVDLKFRRNESLPWTARLITSKNERFDYRVVLKADTAEIAMRAVLDFVKKLDAA